MKFEILFIFLFLFSSVSAANLLIAPNEIFFNSTVGETDCKTLSISTSSSSTIVSYDKWSLNEFPERRLSQYTKNKEDANIGISYNKEFQSEKEGVMEICVTPLKKGENHGVVLIREVGHNSGIGIWVDVDTSTGPGVMSKITGSVVGTSASIDGVSILVGSSVLLILCLGGLVVVLGIKKKNC